MKLITFGCSWTYGTGLVWEEGITRDEYDKKEKDAKGSTKREETPYTEKYAFRSLLAKKYFDSYENYAEMGSSNQKQFRYAKERFLDIPDEPTVVLWGITSIWRTEVWSNTGSKKKGHKNILFGNMPHGLEKCKRRNGIDKEYWINNHFDEDNEVDQLAINMIHWNHFFEGHGISNYWYDTFNTHPYKRNIPRMIKGDLLTRLCDMKDDSYHMSQYWTDCPRITKAKELGLVNPYSLHPTRESHVKIADMLADLCF